MIGFKRKEKVSDRPDKVVLPMQCLNSYYEDKMGVALNYNQLEFVVKKYIKTLGWKWNEETELPVILMMIASDSYEGDKALREELDFDAHADGFLRDLGIDLEDLRDL